jgi:hypothetical protein
VTIISKISLAFPDYEKHSQSTIRINGSVFPDHEVPDWEGDRQAIREINAASICVSIKDAMRFD